MSLRRLRPLPESRALGIWTDGHFSQVLEESTLLDRERRAVTTGRMAEETPESLIPYDEIVQEALHNIWRHSDAKHVDIVIAPTDPTAPVQAATVTITDDGVGFDTATTREGAGVATMRASAAVVEGTFSIESAPGAGTTISACLGPGPESADGAGADGTGADDRDEDEAGRDRPAGHRPPVLRLVPPLEG